VIKKILNPSSKNSKNKIRSSKTGQKKEKNKNYNLLSIGMEFETDVNGLMTVTEESPNQSPISNVKQPFFQ
jgi:hypothetical protein